MMRATLVHISVFLALAAFAEKQPLDRYQSIIDRQMFGPLPRDFDPDKMPSEVAKSGLREQKELTKEQEELKKAVHFSVLNVRQSGEVEVGSSDLSDKESPTHYFLKVGESQNGWKVESADVDAATATLVKDGVVLELSLGDNSAKGGGTAKKAEPGVGGANPRRNILFETARQRRTRQTEENLAQVEKLRKEREAEKAEREAERAEMMQSLQALRDDIKRAREEKSEPRKPEEDGAKAGEEQQTKADEENDN